MTDTVRADGYGVALHDGKVFVHLTKHGLDDALRVETERVLPPGEWHHVLVTYDGSRVAAGVKVYIDGRLEKTKVLLDELNQTFATKEPLRLRRRRAGRSLPRGHCRRGYDDCLTPDEAALSPETVGQIGALSCAKRTPPQRDQAAGLLPGAARTADDPRGVSRPPRAAPAAAPGRESFPTTMVMEEMPVPRPCARPDPRPVRQTRRAGDSWGASSLRSPRWGERGRG